MLKKITTILLVCLLTLSLTGCKQTAKAESAVDGMLKSFKNLDLQQAQEYIENNETDEFEDFDEDETNVLEPVFDKFDYEIVSTETIDENNAIVRTKITAPDMKSVLSGLIMEVSDYVFSNIFANPKPTPEEMTKKVNEIFNKCFSDPELKMISFEMDMKVRKNANGEWKITMDDTLKNSMLIKLLDYADQMISAFDNIQ